VLVAGFVERMVGAARLDANTYEEVEADTGATFQAFGVVVLTAVAYGLSQFAREGVPGLIFGLLVQLISWFIWALAAFVLGTRLLPEPETKSDMGELLRTIGFASSPGILYIVAGLPVPALRYLTLLVVWIWSLAAWVVAVRQALDYKSTGRAVAVCAMSIVIYIVALFLVGIAIGILLLSLGLAVGPETGGS
jgi:hypothetical protein